MKYEGMTANERLWISGLFDELESAIKERDVKRAVEILKRVELGDAVTVKAILGSFGIEWKEDSTDA